MLLLKIFKNYFITVIFIKFHNLSKHYILLNLCIDLIVFIPFYYKTVCKLLLINNVYHNKPLFYKNKKVSFADFLSIFSFHPITLVYFSSSNSFSLFATTTVAIPLPIKLTIARASDMKRLHQVALTLLMG